MDGIELAKHIRDDPRWSGLRLIMLSARDDHDGATPNARSCSRRSSPSRCAARSSSRLRDPRDDRCNPGRPGTRRRRAGVGRRRGVRAAPKILLVEDNPVNREVAVGMLESLGCKTDAAENGRLAIEAMNDRQLTTRCSWIARCRSWTA